MKKGFLKCIILSGIIATSCSGNKRISTASKNYNPKSTEVSQQTETSQNKAAKDSTTTCTTRTDFEIRSEPDFGGATGIGTGSSYASHSYRSEELKNRAKKACPVQESSYNAQIKTAGAGNDTSSFDEASWGETQDSAQTNTTSISPNSEEANAGWDDADWTEQGNNRKEQGNTKKEQEYDNVPW